MDSTCRKPQQFLESHYLSEQFELNMQLLGMEAYPEQREFVAYIEDSLHQPLPSFIEAPTGIRKTYAYLLTLLAKPPSAFLSVFPTKILQDQIMKKEGKTIQDLFQIPFIA